MLRYVKTLVQGLCIGSVDVVPGVSGGTIAFILEIYEELVNSVKSFDMRFIRLVLSGEIKEAAAYINLEFLLPLVLGIGLAMITIANVILFLLRYYPVFIWSFFFGLIVASVVIFFLKIRPLTVSRFLSLLAGGLFIWLIIGLSPASTPETWWFLFLSGAIAACAMILPGISGAFILVLLGKYQFILEAIIVKDILTIIIFSAGALTGLLAFAKLLSKLFEKYYFLVTAFMGGVVAGSLRKIWPWKETVLTTVDRHGEVVPVFERNIVPGLSQETIFALFLIITGFIIMLFIDRIGIGSGISRQKDCK